MKDQQLILYENINPLKIKWLLAQDSLDCSTEDKNEEVKSTLESLLKCYSKYKKFKVVYKTSSSFGSFGRLYGYHFITDSKSIYGWSGSLPKHIRGFLLDDNNIDIDIKRCHWYIIKDLLIKYVNDRFITEFLDNYDDEVSKLSSNAFINQIINKNKYNFCDNHIDKTKDAFFSTLYTQPSFLSVSKQELLMHNPLFNNLHQQIYTSLLPILKDKFKDLIEVVFKKKENFNKENLDGSILSYILQHIEKTIILEIVEFFISNKFSVNSIIHDGIIISKSPNFSEELLSDCSKHIKSTLNYNIKLVSKPFFTNHFPEMPSDFTGIEDDSITKYNILCDQLLSYVADNKLRKDPYGNIYKQSIICPLHYELKYSFDPRPNMTGYNKLLEDAFVDCKLFNSNPAYYDQMMSFIEKRNTLHFLNIDFDMELFGFNNCILNLKTLQVIPINEIKDNDTRVVRHFINKPLDLNNIDGNTSTFDKVISYQLNNDQEAIKWYYIFVGRTFFEPFNDKLQVIFFHKGQANTGKSMMGNIFSAMHRPGSIGTISSNQEQTFGVESFLDKELIIGFDLPENMKETISDDLFKSMATGEAVNVPRKNKKALTISKWSVPQVFISNYYPNYVNKGGSISKRLAIFEFNTPVKNPDSSIEQFIIENELSSIIYKSVKFYYDFLHSENANKTFEDIRPDYFINTNDEFIFHNNKFFQFLTQPDFSDKNGNVYSINMGNYNDSVTLSDINAKFKKWCEFNKHKFVTVNYENTAFKQLNLKIERLKICKYCKANHKKNCCDNYSRNARTTCIKVFGLKFVCMPHIIEHDL